jgi:PAS domain S-box-containing protein
MDKMQHDRRASNTTNRRKACGTNLLQDADGGELGTRDEASPSAIADAHSGDEQSVNLREKAVIVREEAIEERESDLHRREGLLELQRGKLSALRVQEISDAQIFKATREDHQSKLQQANENLIIASIEAQIMAEEIEKSKIAQANYYKTLLNTSNDGIHIVSMDGRLVEASDTFCKMLILARDQVIGKSVTEWYVSVTEEEVAMNIHAGELSDGIPIVFESVFRRGDQTTFDAEVSISQVEFDGSKLLFCAARDITLRKNAEAALRLSNAGFRKLAGHQEMIRENERKRIARDIHDDMGQNLMALRIDVQLMAARPDPDALTKEQGESALAQIDTIIKTVRNIINDLRPSVLNLGLHAAIEWQAKEFQRRSGIICELHMDHDELSLNDEHTTSLFRIVQESLANITRHAQASRVQIALQRKDGGFYLTIVDDGVGLSPDHHKKTNCFGLAGIGERIRAMGGTFSTSSNPGQGLKVMLFVPN